MLGRIRYNWDYFLVVLRDNAAYLVVAFGVFVCIGIVIAWRAHAFDELSNPGRATAASHRGTGRVAHAARTRSSALRHRAAPAPAVLTVTAARGDSWISVRLASTTGRRLYEGVLRRHQQIRLEGRLLVARFGAGANLDARLGNRSISLRPFGLHDVIVTAAGMRLVEAVPAAAVAQPVVGS
jgi:hypothetical protein